MSASRWLVSALSAVDLRTRRPHYERSNSDYARDTQRSHSTKGTETREWVSNSGVQTHRQRGGAVFQAESRRRCDLRTTTTYILIQCPVYVYVRTKTEQTQVCTSTITKSEENNV